MKGNVSAAQADTSNERPLSPRVQEALRELVGVAQEGLMALSEIPIRPPGTRTRCVSLRTTGLSGDRLTTQLEMTTSTLFAGSGMSSIWPRRNSMLVAPALAAFVASEREHLLGHVQPVGRAGGAHAPGGQERVNAAAGAQVQHDLAFT